MAGPGCSLASGCPELRGCGDGARCRELWLGLGASTKKPPPARGDAAKRGKWRGGMAGQPPSTLMWCWGIGCVF
jgi:hypothetical protein